LISIGTKVTHALSKGKKIGTVIPSSGAACFRDQIHVRWTNGSTDYVLPRFLLEEGGEFVVLPRFEAGLQSVEDADVEVEEEQAEELVLASGQSEVESEWSGFTVLEEISQESLHEQTV
jgi:hypothetical protein